MSILLFIVISTVPSYAQRGEMREKLKQKIKIEKIGYLTSELDLTESEALKFWPVFNEYEAKKEKNREAFHSFYSKDSKNADENLKTYLNLKEEEYLIEKVYVEKFKKVLPSEKVLTLMQSEKAFKEELIRKVKQKMRKGDDREE